MEQKKPHYVDNKLFFAEMEKWKSEIAESDEVDDLPPKVTEYMGECFYKIATHLSYRPNFINYTYREEMIGDGIENCIRYAKNFNPDKSKNPFAYFTQIIYYAFIRRIQKEKKQTHVKHKMIEKQEYVPFITMEGDDTPYSIGGFDATTMLPDEAVYKPKKKESVEKIEGLENFMEPKD